MTTYLLINLLIGLMVIALVVFVVNRYLPIDPPLKQIINVIITLIAIVWLLRLALVLP
jgi:hypothetical protein